MVNSDFIMGAPKKELLSNLIGIHSDSSIDVVDDFNLNLDKYHESN